MKGDAYGNYPAYSPCVFNACSLGYVSYAWLFSRGGAGLACPSHPRGGDKAQQCLALIVGAQVFHAQGDKDKAMEVGSRAPRLASSSET